MAVLLGLSLAVGDASAQELADASLDVVISRIDHQRGGHLIIALFDSPARWPDLSQARAIKKLAPQDIMLEIRFNGLNLDRLYAIQAIHDENDNGRLDINVLPWRGPLGPKEGVGMSNNYIPHFAPRFAPAAFSPGDTTQPLEIQLIYLK